MAKKRKRQTTPQWVLPTMLAFTGVGVVAFIASRRPTIPSVRKGETTS